MSDAGEILRAFVAVELPEPVLGWLKAFQQQLKPKFRDVSWTRPEAMHLTLRFLGNIGAEELPTLSSRLAQAAARHAAFPLALGAAGTFGGRVLWIGLSAGQRELAALAEEVRHACEGFGTNDETRPFNAHITLGRPRQPDRRAQKLLNEFAPPPALSWRADTIHLIRSRLLPTGAQYEVLADFPLASPSVRP